MMTVIMITVKTCYVTKFTMNYNTKLYLHNTWKYFVIEHILKSLSKALQKHIIQYLKPATKRHMGWLFTLALIGHVLGRGKAIHMDILKRFHILFSLPLLYIYKNLHSFTFTIKSSFTWLQQFQRKGTCQWECRVNINIQ